MTRSERELDEFGRKALEPLRPVPPLDPQLLAQEKAKFLQHGEDLSRNFMPSHAVDRAVASGQKQRTIRRIFSLPLYKGLAVAILLIILIGGSSFSVLAAQGSLPGEPLYNLKAAGEDIRLSLTFSPQEKLDLTLNYTTRRMSEIQSLVADGKSMSNQASDRYQSELEDALELAAQLNDPQMQSALSEIKNLAESQGITLEELISRLPAQAYPAIVHLQERLYEQVQLSSIGEKNPQAFRLKVRERAKNRHGPKHASTPDEPGVYPLFGTTTPYSDPEHGKGNGMNKPTDVPGDDKPGNGQGQNNPGNGNHGPNPTRSP